MQYGQIGHMLGQAIGERHDNRKNHGGRAHYGRADQHRLRGCLKRVARAIVLFQVFLAFFKVGSEPEIFLDFFGDARHLLNGREFKHGLGIVRHWSVRVHRNGHWAHPEKTERHQAESENCRRHHQALQAVQADPERNGHQRHHRNPQPIGAEIPRHQTGQNIERRATLARRRHHFLNVRGMHGRKYFHQLRNHCAR